MKNEGIERIKILAADVTDKSLLKIIDYLLSRIDMNNKYLNEEKSLSKMIDFIKNKAQKEAKNGIAMIEDVVVYGWAIHYWDETNKSLKLDNISMYEEKENVNPIKKEKKQIKKSWTSEGQLSLFDLM